MQDREGFIKAYPDARKIAGTEMRLDRSVWDRTFPETCEWTLAETLNDEFFPAAITAQTNVRL